MRKHTLWIVGALLALTIPSHAQVVGGQQIVCNKFFQVSQGAVALTKIISGVSGTTISLCGWSANAGAATGTFALSYGTGTNCGTGTTSITPVYSLAINGVLVDHPGLANIGVPQVNASGVLQDVCLVTTGTGPLSIIVYYFQ